MVAEQTKIWYNGAMDKQMTMSFWTDELAEVRTRKKEFLMQMGPIGAMGRMGKENTAALLQRRVRKQALWPGTDVSDLRIAEPI